MRGAARREYSVTWRRILWGDNSGQGAPRGVTMGWACEIALASSNIVAFYVGNTTVAEWNENVLL